MLEHCRHLPGRRGTGDLTWLGSPAQGAGHPIASSQGCRLPPLLPPASLDSLHPLDFPEEEANGNCQDHSRTIKPREISNINPETRLQFRLQEEAKMSPQRGAIQCAGCHSLVAQEINSAVFNQSGLFFFFFFIEENKIKTKLNVRVYHACFMKL